MPPRAAASWASSLGKGCLIAFVVVLLLLIFTGRSCFSHGRHGRYMYRTHSY